MDLSKLSSMNANTLGLFNLTAGEISFRLLLAIGLGFLIAIVFEKTDRGLENNKYTYKVLVFCPAIISTALMALGNSIATAFGLFAALSIIRFRTPIKNIREMLFIFFSIAIGICTGVGSLKIAVISVTIILVGILVDYLWSIRRVIGKVYCLRIFAFGDKFEEVKSQLDSDFSNELKKLKLLEVRTTTGEQIEVVYTIVPKDEAKLPTLVSKVRSVEGIEDVILQTPFLD